MIRKEVVWFGGVGDMFFSGGGGGVVVMEVVGEKLRMGEGSGGRLGSFGKRWLLKLEDFVDSLSCVYNEKVG